MLAAILAPAQASAQAVQATADTQATLLTDGAFAKLADIDFGTIVQPTVAGTLVLSPQAAATCTPSATLIHTGNCRAAAFVVKGLKSQHVRIQDAGDTGIVTLTGPGGATMTMNTMTVSASGMTANGNGQGWRFGNWKITDPSGNGYFWIGGTLQVAALQAPGVYSGTLVMEIQFN